MLRGLAPHCLFLTVYHSVILVEFIPDSSWHRVLLETLSFTFLKLFPVHARGHLIPLMVQVHADTSARGNVRLLRRHSLPDTVKLNQH